MIGTLDSLPTAVTRQPLLFPYEVESTALSTNRTSAHHRVQRWSNFIAGFSLEFVHQCLESVRPPGLVLDPFMGCGTTLSGARSCGFDSVGYEAHPLFAMLAAAKANRYSIDELNEVWETIKKRQKHIQLTATARKFLAKIFSQENLNDLLGMSFQVNSLNEQLKPLGVSLLLKAAEYACTAKTDGIYKAPDSKKRAISFEESIQKAYKIIANDIDSVWYTNWVRSTLATVYKASATSMNHVETNVVSTVITSPPYLNNFDYAEMTRMQLYLLGWAGSWGDITDLVRSAQITNTTTSLRGKKTPEYQDKCKNQLPCQLVDTLVPLVRALEVQRESRRGKKEYNLLVYPYYSQIQSVLKESLRVMEVGARIHWVVSDAALYGIYLPTHQHTAEIMRELGFQHVQIKFLRPRGHRWVLKKRDGAPGKLGEYYITAVK